MNRRAIVAAFSIAVLAAFATVSHTPIATAQETPPPAPPAPSPHSASAHGAAATVPEKIEIHALDLSAMYDASEGGSKQPSEIPLANRAVRALIQSGGTASSLEFKTDAAGNLTIPTASLARGTSVELIVPDPDSATRWPLYASLPFVIGQVPPGELGFVRVHGGESPLAFAQYFMTATVPDREEGTPSLRVNIIAQVENRAQHLWIGPKSDVSRGTLRFRIPKEFTLVAVQVAGQDSKGDVVPRADGANDVVLHDRFWPTVFSEQPQTVRLVLTGPYQETTPYDFSFDSEIPLEELRLNLEQGILEYESGGDGTDLEDGGMNPPMSGRETRGWRVGHIHDGGKINIRFVGGTRIHPKVWLTLGSLALGIAGAFLLARAQARRRDPEAIAAAARKKTSAAAEQPPVVDVDAKLRELDQRHRKGEITSFEYEARKRALTVGPVAPRAAAHAPVTGHAGNTLDDISARVDTADVTTLRRDVRTLLAMLRGKGR
ncbi:MAG: SHOCT domain-containing protein [Planctomycetes bacterium]|nr:SHOCT domain-containing protein [Planctomycetota bacterium]